MNVCSQLWSHLAEASGAEQDARAQAWSFDGKAFHQHSTWRGFKEETFVGAIVPSGKEPTDLPDSFLVERLPFYSFDFIYQKDTAPEVLDVLRNYWSLRIASQVAEEVPFTMVHMAVSLDGKISTLNGHSKWIGNEQNLDHAHRLRAMLDGILIGAGTVRKDSPSLNVRRVEGKSPARFVLSNESEDFEQLKKLKEVPTYLVRHKNYSCKNLSSVFDDVIVYEGNATADCIKDILRRIRQKGVRSLLIEGGSGTVSSFIAAQAVNVLQLHHTPIILGSGKNMINLPTIETIGEGKTLENAFYTPMGNAIMTTGALGCSNAKLSRITTAK